MDALAQAASAAFTSLVRLSVQASALILLLALVLWICGRKMSPAWRHGLWLLVLVRLALPWSVQSPSSLFNWLHFTKPSTPVQNPHPPRATANESAAVAPSPSPPREGERLQEGERPREPGGLPIASPIYLPQGVSTVNLQTKDGLVILSPAERSRVHASPQERPKHPGWSWPLWVLIAWLLGVMVLISRVLLDSLRLWRAISPVRLVTDSRVLELLEDCKQLMGVRAPLGVVQTPEVSGPVLYGFIRPRLLLPEGLLANFSPEELRFIFLHELAHVKRRDIIISWIMTAAQILHWFNPLVWLCFARMRKDRELACDAMALSHTRENENQQYGQTILRLLQDFCGPARMPAMAAILEDQSEVETRIRGIAGFRRVTYSPRIAIVLAVLLVAVMLTDARDRRLPDGALSVPVQALDLQAEDGVDLRRALARGEVSLRAEADWTNALAEGRVKVGEINGLALDRWIPLGSDEAPSPRWGNTVVWTGREAVVWGGGATNFFYHDGARYDPVAFLWRAMSTNHSLAGRWFHAAVWTGREMLVWGGRAHGLPKTNAFQNGARYDPQTDTWKPISALGALSPRSQTAAVWTGRELIVWGGVADGYTPLADGARYNPETDTWKALPPCALEPRWEMSAVWTGTEMIVWGGVVQSAGKLRVFGDGARYNPGSDTWTALPSAGTFRARSAHTAVWTGTEMIIWGGVDSATTTYFNSGARYDPRLNRWTILPLFNAPEARAYHVGVWTGAEMVVWGGRVTSRTDVNTGGRYDPVRDLWLSTTTHDAPRPRDFVRRDSAAWIDCGMFIFGGRDLEREFGTAHLWEPTHPVPLFRRAATRK